MSCFLSSSLATFIFASNLALRFLLPAMSSANGGNSAGGGDSALNPHNPLFLVQAPWYLNQQGGDTLEHQKVRLRSYHLFDDQVHDGLVLAPKDKEPGSEQ